MIYKTDASPELCYLTVTKEKGFPSVTGPEHCGALGHYNYGRCVLGRVPPKPVWLPLAGITAGSESVKKPLGIVRGNTKVSSLRRASGRRQK